MSFGFDYTLLINNNRVVWAVGALCINMGSRFVAQDLTPMQQKMLAHPAFKRTAIFFIIFMVTRDVVTAICVGFVVIMALEHFLNENSRFCIVPGARPSGKATPATTATGNVVSRSLNAVVSSVSKSVHETLPSHDDAAMH